jgi:hypothetical protein
MGKNSLIRAFISIFDPYFRMMMSFTSSIFEIFDGRSVAVVALVVAELNTVAFSFAAINSNTSEESIGQFILIPEPGITKTPQNLHL